MSDEGQDLKWVPLAQRKRKLADLARPQDTKKSKVGDKDDDGNQQTEVYTAGPRAKISLLDQVALEMVKRPGENGLAYCRLLCTNRTFQRVCVCVCVALQRSLKLNLN
jgi:hypothetical protein